jgi:hypothetical protein
VPEWGTQIKFGVKWQKTFFLKLCIKTNELIMSDALEPGDIPEFESLLVEYSEKGIGCQEQNPGVFQKLTPKPHF